LIRAETVDVALRNLLEFDFAVVLLDLQMTGLDGFETGKMIRNRDRSRQTPIIFLTARESPDFPVVKAYALGAVDYLHKPLMPEILKAKVAGFVDLFQKTEQVNRQAKKLRELERDQFEHMLAEERQRWELDRLREEARRKNDFLAVLAHELRNPLAPIRNSVQLLRLKRPAEPESEWAHDVIDRQVQQMTRVVDDLLDVSRITRGKIKLQKETVDIASVIGRAVEIAQPLIEARSHQFAVTLPPEPLLLELDPLRLAQVIANLLNNAAKYTEEGGRIWLSAERQDDQLFIRVRDTGVGIPPQYISRIFELFVQEGRAPDQFQAGLGIGLSLARNLVELHGGAIRAESLGPGQGSEFEIRLPIVVGKPPATVARTKHQITQPKTPLRILVVDDNVDSAKSLGLLLRHCGHEVRIVHDGRAGLDEVAAWRPTVVLLDIGLPRVDGLEVARRIRNDLQLRNVLLVAMTGYGQVEDRRRSQEAGFNVHLVKPIDLDALFELLAHPDLVGGEIDGTSARTGSVHGTDQPVGSGTGSATRSDEAVSG
jgi:signal transduction histidine kinase